MKYIKIAIVVFVIGGIYLSCERDDLCPETTQTTAKLVMGIFDVAIPDDSKNVFGLRIQGVDNDDVLEGYNVVTTNSLILPLRTDANETKFKLHQNYAIDDNGTPNDPDDDFATGNEDIITITYIKEDVFVSRACGYRTIFSNVGISIENDGDNWIQLIQAENDNQIVENETEAHFKLFH
ncbi:DUF6452 family protein [Algibacter sp. 2305UL17-15]|uniref:DUF6452 family protein n=1 Tax=Algibacter sp. 2305UL17-15 TaxID=3231268 RepID=UPI0034574348